MFNGDIRYVLNTIVGLHGLGRPAMTLRFLHLVTVGTSVIRNASSHEGISEDLRSRLTAWSTAPPGSSEDLEASNRAAPGTDEFKAVLGYVSGNPRKASAELNAFIGYLEHLVDNGVRGVEHRIVLLSTDTGAGWFSTRVLEEYLKEVVGHDLSKIWGVGGHKVVGVESRRIEKLGVDFSEGILGLIAEVKKIILRVGDKYDRVLANLTGGFKPESAAVLVAAGLLGIDAVYYIHEAMRNVVELPVIPLRVDENARKLLVNALDNRMGSAERKLLRKLGLPVTGDKISPWARRLLELLLY